MSKKIYDEIYTKGSREILSGYEYARWHALRHFISKVIKLQNNKMVLDYGCGNGLFVGLFKEIFYKAELYFCDISSVALEQLQNKYPEYRANCVEIKENKTQFKDGMFDVIVSVEVMEHAEKLDDYLMEIYRLLRKGGVFVWTTPCGNPFSIEDIWGKLTAQIEKTREGYVRWKWESPTHLRRLKSKEIREKLISIGFNSVDFRFRAHLFSFLCTYFLEDPCALLEKKLCF